MLKKITALFLSTVIMLSSFGGVVSVSANKEAENLIAGVNYTMSIADEHFHSAHPDFDYSMLTDGVYGTDWEDSAAVGFHTKDSTKTFSMTFEFENPIVFKQIVMGFFGGKAGIKFPSGLVVERRTSSGNDWETIYSGSAVTGTGRADTVLATEENIYAYALKFTLTGGGVWTFMDEIDVFAETSTVADGILETTQKVIAPQIIKDLDESIYIEEGSSYTMKVDAVSPEGGEVSYQWYKENTPVGENTPSNIIENATAEDAGSYRVEITNTVNGYSASQFSKTSTVLVGNSDASAYPPEIDKDIASGCFLTSGDELKLEVSARSVDGGEILYQWYKDGEKIDGATSSVFSIESVKVLDEGVYEAQVINTKNGTSVAVFSNDCTVTVKKEPVNLITGKKYTTSVTADGFHTNGTDVNGEKLTDGVMASKWNSGEALGVHTKDDNVTFDIDFALGNAIEFRQINIGFLGNTSGIKMPSNVKVFVKNENNNDWTEIFSGQPKSTEKRYEFLIGCDEIIKATELKFTVTGSGAWAFIDEISVYDVLTGETLAGNLTPPSYDDDDEPDAPVPQDNNLVYGKKYTSSIIPDSKYPDTDGKELTDGVLAVSPTTSDAAWAGFNGKIKAENNVIFDLEEVKSFEEVKVNFLTASGGISVPNNILIEISSDGNQWTPFMPDDSAYSVIIDLGEEQEFQRVSVGFLNASGKTAAGVYEYISAVPEAVNARYVRLSWVFDTSWVFVDEVQINAVQTPREKNTPEKMGERVSDPDPENIAFGKSYEVNSDFASFYPDSGIKLTDGRHGTSSADSKEWVAFNAPEGNGGYQSVENTSSKYPTSVKVEYSSNKTDWKFFTDSELDALQGASAGTSRFDYGQPFASKGRYIKVTVTGTDFVALDEIEVFKTFDGTLDDELTDDSKLSYNLSANYPVTASRNADTGDVSMLTDGVYGEWVKYEYKGTSDDHVVLDFDLTALNSVEEISFHTRSGSGVPSNLVFKVSTDGNKWVTVKEFFSATKTDEDGRGVTFVWNGDVDTFNTYVENASAIYTRFVRVEFDVPAGKIVSVDEMKIIGKRGKTSSSAIAIDNPVGEHNLALGKPYERVPALTTPAYPDTNDKELTDGIHGTTSYMDSAWTGHLLKEKGPTNETKYREEYKSYIVDLGELKTITSVKATFLGSISNGINVPKYCDTLVSVDGYNWMKLSHNDLASIRPTNQVVDYGWHVGNKNGENKDMTNGAEMVVARYVRVFWELVTTTMIDEIEVMGYDEVKTGDNVMSAEEVAKKATPHDNGGDYLTPAETGGIHDLLLCYNGWYEYDKEGDAWPGEWDAFRFKPMLTYIDENGNPVDTLYDAVLFLALNANSGRGHGWDTSWNADDIYYWLNQMFKEGGDVDELNKAALQVREDLNLPDYKVKLVMSFPQVFHEGDFKPDYFGYIEGREIVDIEDMDNFEYYTRWWVDVIQEKLAEKNYEAIDFTGYYWTHEHIQSVDSDDAYVMKTAEIINEAEEKYNDEFLFYWIPYKSAGGTFHARKNNFDVWSIQTGTYFIKNNEEFDYGYFGNPGSCTTVAATASYLHASMEFEFNGSVATDPHKYNAFLDYINAAVEYNMTGRDVYRSWYQGKRDLYDIAYSKNKDVRKLYDAIYGIINGTLTEQIPHIVNLTTEMIDSSLEKPGFTTGGNVGGGGSYYDDPVYDVIETAKPSEDGYTWFTVNNGYKLKDKEGNFVKGWVKVSGDWYYLDNDGYMKNGWLREENTWYYLKDNGVMANNGWYKVDNIWYYFGESGAMKKGWVSDNGRWYYMMPSGAMAKACWVEVNGKWYYFTQSGAMMTGWVLYKNDWYYLDASGAMVTGWKLIKGEWYYLDPANGKMLKNTTVDGYRLAADGRWTL